jgi:hypothetical protein
MGSARRKQRSALLGGALALLFAALPAQAGAVQGTEYTLHLAANGSEDVSDISHVSPQYSSMHQTASWTVLPRDVNVWLPRSSGPPGEANAGATEYLTVDSRISEQSPAPSIGEVKETGTYEKSVPEGEPVSESYSCSGPVTTTGTIKHRVITTPLDPTVEIESDFQEVLASNYGAPLSNAFGPCWEDSGYTQTGYFFYAWNQPEGQRLQVGMLVPATEIGDPFIGGPAADYNNVAARESSEACNSIPDPTNPCPVSFKLGGEYSLTKVCDGTITAAGGTCGAAGQSKTGEEKKPKAKKPGGKKGKQGKKSKKPKCVVPPLKGVVLAQAKQKLRAAHCKAGTVTRRKSKLPKRRVISTKPKAGARRKAGTAVDLTVSAGPAKRKHRRR